MLPCTPPSPPPLLAQWHSSILNHAFQHLFHTRHTSFPPNLPTTFTCPLMRWCSHISSHTFQHLFHPRHPTHRLLLPDDALVQLVG